MKSYEILRQNCETPNWDDFGVPEETRKSFAQAMLQYTLDGAHGFWHEPTPNGDGHCDPEKFCIVVAERLAAISTLYNGASMQSPIEHMLLGALIWMNVDWADFPSADMLDGPSDDYHSTPSDRLEFWITPQAKVGNYRVDFLLWFKLKRNIAGIAVECDGHQYHEKTKEQAARDKRRDREILRAGYPVMRFTGSEIYKDAISCAEQVRDALSTPLNNVSKDGGLFDA